MSKIVLVLAAMIFTPFALAETVYLTPGYQINRGGSTIVCGGATPTPATSLYVCTAGMFSHIYTSQPRYSLSEAKSEAIRKCSRNAPKSGGTAHCFAVECETVR